MRTDIPVFTAEVTARTVITPRMLRLTVSGARTADGARFVSCGRPDEFFGLWLTTPEGEEVKRYYSVRAWRPETDELDIDFVVHAHGPATRWARDARIGDEVAFDLPRGHYTEPAGTERVLLIGDATALPAIGRILDERTAAAPRVHAILSVDDAQDRQDLRFRADDTVQWVTADAIVPATVTATEDRPDSTYLWFSGEATTMREIRRHVRHTLQWPTARYMTMGYWRRDAEHWERRFDQETQLPEQLAAIWENGEDDEIQRDLADELLSRYGL
ncbi:siderophore-interacting protein [Microbacterium sp. EST19A]|uniref:siderophore-interacting protein n=1 Tax=Microbacterium sp. EST19A TaxID=2862681 RepID=UPI001CBFC034|nr:siderophore-interacting protein [Microbacterium sp. EST19A]